MPRQVLVFCCVLALGCAKSDAHPDPVDASVEPPPPAAAVVPLVKAPSAPGGHTVVTPGARACADVPIDLVRPVCAADGWCWSHPLPQGNPLLGAIGFVDDAGQTTELWAVGALGIALRLRGGSWEPVPTGTTTQLNAIWGTGPTDLWAVGEAGAIFHYDGAVWTPVDAHDTVSLRAVWGSGRRDVWVAGARGHVLHWDGASWRRSPNPVPNDLYGIWGVANDTRVNETKALWVVGAEGAHVKWNGSKWSIVPPLHPYSSYSVFGTSPNNVWAGAEWGVSVRYDGVEWATSPTRSPFPIFAMGGTGPSDVWAAGGGSSIAHYDGTAWTLDIVGTGAAYRAAWACGSNSAWFVGPPGKVVQWTEEKGYTVRSKAFLREGIHGGEIADARAIGGSGPDDVWVAMGKGLVHWNGTEWRAVPDTESWGFVYSVWASGPNDVYFSSVGTSYQSHLIHWDGHTWSEPAHPIFEAPYGFDAALGGTGPNDVWLTAKEQLLHYDGRAWTTVATGIGGQRVWAAGPEDLWIVGTQTNQLHHFRSGVVTTTSAPGGMLLRDIWGSSPDDLWAVGGAGSIAHFDGASWAMQPKITSRALYGVWGSSASDVWVVGDGVVLHYDGVRWNASYDVTVNRLSAVWGRGKGDVWAVGDHGAIVRRRVP